MKNETKENFKFFGCTRNKNDMPSKETVDIFIIEYLKQRMKFVWYFNKKLKLKAKQYYIEEITDKQYQHYEYEWIKQQLCILLSVISVLKFFIENNKISE